MSVNVLALATGSRGRIPPTRRISSIHFARQDGFVCVENTARFEHLSVEHIWFVLDLRCISTPLLYSPRHIGEPRQVQLMRNGHGPGRTVTVFGENEIRFSATWVIAFECVRAVQQDYHVGILF